VYVFRNVRALFASSLHARILSVLETAFATKASACVLLSGLESHAVSPLIVRVIADSMGTA